MPFTPYHLGPGLLIKGLAPRHLSWTAFALAQVVVDVEPLVYLLRREPPFHRELHTLAGGFLAGTLAALLLLGLRKAGRHILAAGLPVFRKLPPSLQAELASLPAIWIGALLGGLSHVLIDSLVYAEMQPFRPFSAANPFFGWLDPAQVTGLCLAAGLAGLLLVGFWVYWEDRRMRHAPREERP